MSQIRVEIESKSSYIKALRQVLKEFLRVNNYNEEDEIFMFELALNEAIANVIEHTYNFEENHSINVEFSIDEERVFCIKIRDFGRKVDPQKIQLRDLEDHRDGGLGVFIIQKVFGNMRWDDVPEGNLLYLYKKL